MENMAQGEWRDLTNAHDDDVETEMGTDRDLVWARCVGRVMSSSEPRPPRLVGPFSMTDGR